VSEVLAFLVVSVVVIVTPGQDTALTIRNTLLGGRRGGVLTAVGVSAGQACWTLAASAGIAALLQASEPAFLALRLAGAAYLVFLGLQALRGAFRGSYATVEEVRRRRGGGFRRFREGFLSNVTNPKVLVLFLSVLPQFLTAESSVGDSLLLAYTVAVLGGLWLLALLLFVHRVRTWLGRRRVRRTLDGVTGTALLGFGAALALES
jgi:threonine/homoserine/homoserine lactone efflux protein